MGNSYPERHEMMNLFIRISFLTAATYFSVKWMINHFDPNSKKKLVAKKKVKSYLFHKINFTFLLCSFYLSHSFFNYFRPKISLEN